MVNLFNKKIFVLLMICFVVTTLLTSCQNDIFAVTKYKLTLTSGDTGTTNPAGTVEVEKGIERNIKGIPNEGYHFSSWESTGNTTGSIANINEASTSIILNNADVTVRANFILNVYNLTFENDGNGTTNKTGTIPVGHNEEIEIVAIPNTCYEFAGWTVSSGDQAFITFEDASLANTTVSITCDNITIKANFKIKSQILTVTNGIGGLVTAPLINPKEIVCGETETIAATALTGYIFSNWSVESGSASFENDKANITTVRISEDTTVKANFMLDTNMKGILQVKSNIVNASVYIDGLLKGKIPFATQLKYGEYVLRVTSSSYGEYTSTICVNQPEVVVTVTLRKP
jgi:hypothetical protein